ncbi:ABC transporter permease [Candidatus Omnitrophota bacterium]
MFCELWLSQRYLRTGKREKIISLTALISMIGIAIGVSVLIVVISVMSGFDDFLQEKMTGTNSHIVLDFYNAQRHPYGLIDELQNLSEVEAASPFIDGQAFIKSGRQVIGAQLRGIDPKLQPRISKIEEYLVEGDIDLRGNEVLLGEELAFRLGVGLGEMISLISPVTLKETGFLIKGLFNSGMYLYDAGLIMTSIKAAQEFYGLGDSVSAIGIKVQDIYRVESLKEEIYASLSGVGPYQIRTWIDTNRNFLHALKLEKTVMFIVVTMTTVVAAFGIVSTLIMSVMTRIKDVGILRSIGANTRSILQVFIFQGLTIGIAGIILGVIAGISLALSLNRIVDFVSGLIGRSLIPADIYYFDRIPTSINAHDVSLILISALAISFLASIYPAYYATRILPSEAVRHE